MWVIRIIKGEDKDKCHDLKSGTNVVGRGLDANIRINEKSMSRNHFQIVIRPNLAVIKDLNSRNGTFLNGILVKQSNLKEGDKISIHKTVLEFTKQSLKSQPVPVDMPKTIEPENLSENQISDDENESVSTSSFSSLKNSLENIFMKGIYNVVSWGEFKWVIGSIIICYIVLVTILSIIPMVNISKERIQQESLLRANDIGQRLSNRYKNAKSMGLQNSFAVEESRLEGVNKALVINANDGYIIAPSKLAGSDPDLPFVHKARRNNAATLEVLDSKTIGVSIPIQELNPHTGNLSISSFAVILYDMGDRTFQKDDVIRLVVQVLAFAIVFGFILFVMLMRLIEKPLFDINKGLDHSLKGGEKQVSHSFNFPILQNLITNINSALSRISDNKESEEQSFNLLPFNEAKNLVESINIPAMVIDNSLSVIAINPECENLIGANDGLLLNKNIDEIPDQSLLLNLKDLISQSGETPDQLLSNKLEFSAVEYNIKITAVGGADSIKYFFITLNREAEEEL